MPSTPYRTVLSTAQHKMTTAIAQIRDSIPHAGETGDLVERVLRSQLQEVLPEKVGVSSGFVVDSEGKVSRQMDIILYDRQNTPRIFTSEGAQMFPVEATYACGEIKTNLNSAEFRDSFDKCLSYKRLTRRAYYSQPKSLVHRLFGRQYDHWQSIFFCIAAHSTRVSQFIPVYRSVVEERALEVHERIDTVVALDATDNENILLNGSVELETGLPRDGSIDFLPCAGSQICAYPAKESWALFIMLLLRYMTQAPMVAVDMLPYGGSEPY